MSRGRLEISLDVLVAISEGNHRITHINRVANYNPSSLKGVLNELIFKGLVWKSPLGFELTPKGVDALDLYFHLRSLFGFGVEK